jgi:glutathione S-transferase
MKLYDFTGAPNPRRATIFLKEKNLPFETIHCDMAKGEHKSPEFLKKNPSGKIPVLETDDGRFLGESVAICRYLEAIAPEPNLFGKDPFELGYIEMRNRQIELELSSQISVSWVNGPIVSKMGLFKPNDQAKETSDVNVNNYYGRLDREFAENDYTAGDRFTIADISLICAVDFAKARVDLKPDESLENLWRWHARVSARDSVASTPATRDL